MTGPTDKEGDMGRFFEIGCLTETQQDKLAAEIEDAIAAKIKDRLLTEKEVREIEEMRLKPLLDILDIQSVYENHLFREKG
jgi:predicted Zn-dependent peptidase